MDKVGADFIESVKSMVDRLGANPVPIQIPIGAENDFRGPVDLISMKAVYFDDETLGAKYVVDDIPEELRGLAQEYRDKMIEKLADCDESVMEKYIAGEEVTPDEIRSALRRGTIEMKLTPVLCGSSFKNKGVQDALRARIVFRAAEGASNTEIAGELGPCGEIERRP